MPGYIDSRFGDDYDQEDTTAVRAMLGWRITDSLELSLLAMKQDMHLDGRTSFSTEDLDLPYSPTLNGGPLPSEYYTSDHARSSRDDEIEMYSAKLVFTQGWGTITGASSLFERYSGYVRDASAAAEVLSAGRLSADSTGISLIGGRDGWPKAWIRSSELRFSSDWESSGPDPGRRLQPERRPPRRFLLGYGRSEHRTLRSRTRRCSCPARRPRSSTRWRCSAR